MSNPSAFVYVIDSIVFVSRFVIDAIASRHRESTCDRFPVQRSCTSDPNQRDNTENCPQSCSSAKHVPNKSLLPNLFSFLWERVERRLW